MTECLARAEQLFLPTERICRVRKNKRQIENTFLAFYRANIFHHRLSYKTFFARELVQVWELYLSEIQVALDFLGENEKKFLEDCFNGKVSRKISSSVPRASYYCCLNRYSDRFLDLFDFEFFYWNAFQLKKAFGEQWISVMQARVSAISIQRIC